ncbi:unnamed protein product [Orchesella dallaii]
MTCKTGIKPYLCYFCGIGYSSKSNFEQHIRTHQGENSLKCQICDKTFSRKSVMRDHINFHNGIKPHICNVCNDGFSSRRALSVHVKNHTIEQTQPHVYDTGHYPITILMEKDGRRYECNICKKKFRTEYTIMIHLSSFTGKKAFNCELCGKRFFTNRNLESHFQAVHKDECQFKCSVCKMGFPQQDLLEDHIISTHTSGSKPFKCKVCNSGFNIHSQLKAHMMIHTGERPHECHCCSARFIRKSHLKLHSKRHERQDKIRECMKNELNLIPQQQLQNLTVNPQETEVNVNNDQKIDDEALNIQNILETSLTLGADNNDPAHDFDELAYDVVWIDSERFSTINSVDWNLLGCQKKRPEALVTNSVTNTEHVIITSALGEIGESSHIPVAVSSMDQTVSTISHHFLFCNS